MESLSAEINFAAAKLAPPVLTSGLLARRRNRATLPVSRPDQPHGVYFSGRQRSGIPNITFDQLVAAYRESTKALVEVART